MLVLSTLPKAQSSLAPADISQLQMQQPWLAGGALWCQRSRMKLHLCASVHKGHTAAVVLWQRVLVMLNQAPLLLGQAAAEILEPRNAEVAVHRPATGLISRVLSERSDAAMEHSCKEFEMDQHSITLLSDGPGLRASVASPGR